MSQDLVSLSEQALDHLDTGEAIPGYVFVPPRLRGRRSRVMYDVAVTRSLPDIRENIVRIQNEVDPIGLMIAIANGQPVATWKVDPDGSLKVVYETVDLKDRLKIIQALADRVHPRMSVNQALPAPKPPKEGDRASAAALIEAAERAAG